MRRTLLAILSALICINALCQSIALQNMPARSTRSLSGEWKWVMDPDPAPLRANAMLKDLDFSSAKSLFVPGDWNTQEKTLFSHQGKVWYSKEFDYRSSGKKNAYLHFDGVGGDVTVWVNRQKVGSHSGPYSPFDLDVTGALVADGHNSVVICVDSRLPYLGESLPWFNYGGILRNICIVETQPVFLKDYLVRLSDEPMNRLKERAIRLEFELSEPVAGKIIRFDIPEIGYSRQFKTDKDGKVSYTVFAAIDLWSVDNPRLYTVKIQAEGETITDKIGFRTIATEGGRLLLNGEQIFLTGVNIADESAFTNHFIGSKDEVTTLLKWVRELGCNFIRLSHHPQSEAILRDADQMGILVWEEFPLTDDTAWDDRQVLHTFMRQFDELHSRDKNRASAAFWSLGESSPSSDTRTAFIDSLAGHIRKTDNTRLISLAMPLDKDADRSALTVNDPVTPMMDIICISQDIVPGAATAWDLGFDKPVLLTGFECREDVSPERRAEILEEQISISASARNLCGISAGYLKDYRSADMSSQELVRSGHYTDQGERRSTISVISNLAKSRSKK